MFTLVGLLILWIALALLAKKVRDAYRQRKGKREAEIAAAQRKLVADRVLGKIVEETTKAHMRTLRAQVSQRQVTDAYGNVDTSKATEQVNYFILNVILRQFREAGFDPTRYANDAVEMLAVFKRVTALMIEDIRRDPSHNLESVHTGVEYEQFCRQLLEDAGWVVMTTPVTGDQGADLIASKGNSRVVFQCKFYSSAVGNKAVQEAFAAKAFQRADFAVVVSNASYTSSARQLAQTNGVFLVHHESLSSMEEILGSDHFVSDEVRVTNSLLVARRTLIHMIRSKYLLTSPQSRFQD